MTLRLTNSLILANKREQISQKLKKKALKAKFMAANKIRECELIFQEGKTYIDEEIGGVIKVGDLLPAKHGRYFNIIQHPDHKIFQWEDRLEEWGRNNALWSRKCIYFCSSDNQPKSNIIVPFDTYNAERFNNYKEVIT